MRPSSLAAALCFTVLLVSGLACSKTPASLSAEPKKAVILDAGGSAQLAVTVKDKEGSPISKAQVVFSSADKDVAEVEAAGKVFGIRSGDTEITATCGTVSTTIPVSVRLLSTLRLALASEGDTEAAGPLSGTYPLKVTALDEQQKPANLDLATWKSSDPKVATVDKAGVLTLLAPGRTEISVQQGKTATKLPVTVDILIPSAIKLDAPTLSLQRGQSAPLAFSIVSNRGSAMVGAATFTSSASGVATVDDKGAVTGVGRGSAQVKIQAGEAANTVTVTVR